MTGKLLLLRVGGGEGEGGGDALIWMHKFTRWPFL